MPVQTSSRARRLVSSTSVALLAAFAAGHAAAQSADKGIETVTVTAEKRTTLLQKTPVAVTALTASALEKNRIDTFQDLALRVPNLTYTQFSPQEAYFSIRGTLINNNAAGWDDAVTTFIDGVPTTGLGDQNPDLFDLSEIEVLRGPQGTLFGRNVTGGAVVIHTAPPSFDPEGKVEISYGNYNAVQARGFISGPLTDTVAAKLSVSVNHKDAFINNVTLGGKTDGDDEYDVRGQLLWEAAPDLEVLLGADFMRDNGGGYPSRVLANFTPALFPNLSYNPNTTNQGFNGFDHREIGGGMARVTWTNPYGVLTSITGYRNVDDNFPNNVLGDPINQLLQTNTVQDKQVTQEFDFASPTDQRLSWVGGLFYLHSNNREGGPLVFAFSPATIAGLFSADTHYTQTAIQRIGTDSYAVFGEATFAASDSVKVTVGARETWERKAGTSVVTYSISDPAHLFPGDASYGHTWNAFTPKVNLSYQAWDGLLLYATVSRGFKSGGYDLSGDGANSVTNVNLALATPFQQETVWNYEAGEKYTSDDGMFSVDGDVFLADYKKMQLAELVLLPNNQLANITSNAPGTTTVQGAELESTARPTDWLDLGLTYAFLDAHFSDDTRVPYTPRHQVNVSGDVHFPVEALGGEISLAGDYTFHSKVLFDKSNIPPAYIENRSAWNGIVNAHADYTSDDALWRFSIWGKNLTDDRALLRASNVGVLFQNLAEFGNANDSLFLVKYYPERTFGVSLTRDF
jgi:iron complex outermembrane receptor protein